jgi:hypothetical protein
MRTIRNPAQIPLFDPLDQLSEMHRRAFMDSPEGLIRAAILEALPVDALAQKFCAHTGAPTKELYSMAGLVLMMEFNDWTVAKAVDEYMWNQKVHLALNIDGHYPGICERTLYRYMKHFADDNAALAQEAMERVTKVVVEIGELDTSKQRLDSTHIFSNMATFGRTRMMGVAIKRFLTQVLRHAREAYEALDEELRQRYAPSQGRLFADTARSRCAERHTLLRQQVAEDMHTLIGIFETHERLSNADSFKALLRIFEEQCEVVGEAIQVRQKTGGNVMQNPSDKDATYDGHKGPGYQSQFSETCSGSNEIQVITATITETAAASDMDAVEPVLDVLEQNEMTPDELQADAGYGSDKNVEHAAARGVDLHSPTRENADPSQIDRQSVSAMNIDDFVINEETEEVIRCPAGHEPVCSVHDESTGKTKTTMPSEACSACDFSGECPIKRSQNEFHLEHSAKERRLEDRRRLEATEAFAENYNRRAGIESTNSGLKQVTGAGRLRVRGLPRVTMAMALKVAGWNILRGSTCAKIREYVQKRLSRGPLAAKSGHHSSPTVPVIRLTPFRPVFEQKAAA